MQQTRKHFNLVSTALKRTFYIGGIAITCSVVVADHGTAHADEPSLASYVGEAPPALPQVYLEQHVPARWLTGASDRMPLQPKRWRTRMPRRCRTQGGYRDHCQGKRIVAEPEGAALDLSEKLALGHRAVALHLRLSPAIKPWLDAAKNTDSNPRLTFPVPDGRRGRGFGRVRKGSLSHRKHLGIDIGGERGSAIVAARGGLVVFSDNTVTGYGNAVMILHEDDSTTFYAHCERTVVAPGEYVRRGQKIAEIGKTGFAGAPHLHFEWRTRGWARNPAPHFIWPEHKKKPSASGNAKSKRTYRTR